MNRKEAIEMWVIPALKNTWNEKKCDEILKALEQEPCDDCISRQEAIDAIWDGVNMDIYTREVKECLEKLPSVTPAEKVGNWVKTISENGITSAVRCSECGFEDNRYMMFGYCPKCKAKMQEVEE